MTNQSQGPLYPRRKGKPFIFYSAKYKLGSFVCVCVRWSLELPKGMRNRKKWFSTCKIRFYKEGWTPTFWLGALVHLAKPLIYQGLTSYDVSFMSGRWIAEYASYGAASAKTSDSSSQVWVQIGPRKGSERWEGPRFARWLWKDVGHLKNYLRFLSYLCNCVFPWITR